MLHAVIMAGGSGTRFWPASRATTPKQLLPLVGERTMLQDTLSRLGDLVSTECTKILTNRALVTQVQEQLPELAPTAIVGEPCKRDTAPCIGLAAILVAQQDPDATMVVMPADHVITPAAQFREAVEQAAGLVERDPQRIVTFGIRPAYPAESFGYIERGEAWVDQGISAFDVKKFHEKPQAEVANRYVESGNFYWNSGIFLWKAETILAALREYEPQMFAHLRRIGESIETADYQKCLAAEFAAIEGKSIDFAVMERYPHVVVMEASFEWDDLGSWQSIARRQGSDESGNTVIAKHLGIETRGCIVRGEGSHLIVTLGLEDCIVVHTEDATLVARKEMEESIRQVVSLLKERDWKEYL